MLFLEVETEFRPAAMETAPVRSTISLRATVLYKSTPMQLKFLATGLELEVARQKGYNKAMNDFAWLIALNV